MSRPSPAISLSGMAARSFASQGQQRSAVLAMKLAEAGVLAQSCGEEPVVFLDDVLSELDAARQEYLLRQLHGRQVFLTGCELPGVIPESKDGGLFVMDRGVLKPQ